MADIVIFGATPAGAQLKASIGDGDRVLCFADYDRAKAGTTFEDCHVVHPAALLELTFDRVMMATNDHASTLTFLLKLGIPLHQIEGLRRSGSAAAETRPAAVIYGSRMEALRTFQYVEKSHHVSCFCDPDAAMQGRQVAGRFVVAPGDLCVLRFDRIFIGVSETYKAVHDLLWHWNVPIEKMDVVPDSVLLPPALPHGSERPRCVIVGAGSSGERAFQQLRTTNDIVAFFDNNPAKHGTTFCGRPVHSLAALASFEFDRVVIGSMFAGEIMSQLTTLGVDSARIVLLDQMVALGARSATASRPPFWRRLLAHEPGL
jgi:hypothetical protein